VEVYILAKLWFWAVALIIGLIVFSTAGKLLLAHHTSLNPAAMMNSPRLSVDSAKLHEFHKFDDVLLTSYPSSNFCPRSRGIGFSAYRVVVFGFPIILSKLKLS
jgi:hypothetical protein